MPDHDLFLVSVSTTAPNFFPYCHFRDQGHRPTISARVDGDEVVLTCSDLFKIKPNLQIKPKNRLDVYLSPADSIGLAGDLVSMVGAGEIAELAGVNPEGARLGAQQLPDIKTSYAVRHVGTRVQMAGRTASSPAGRVYVDLEDPKKIQAEMAQAGRSVHLGIPLEKIEGDLDTNQITPIDVPAGELRSAGERNPVNKADATVTVRLAKGQARHLAATLIHLSQRA